MATYGALPKRFASIHPKFMTPGYGTVVAGIIAGTFYTVLTFVSEAVLTDTILSLGLMICFYYGLTAIGCIWYLPQGTVHQLLQLHLQVPVPAARRPRTVVRLLRHPAGQRRPGVRQRRRASSGSGGAGARPRPDPDRRRLHVHLAGKAAGVLPGRDPEARGGSPHEAARAPGVLIEQIRRPVRPRHHLPRCPALRPRRAGDVRRRRRGDPRGAVRRWRLLPGRHPLRPAGDPDDRLPPARRLAALPGAAHRRAERPERLRRR